MDPTAAPAVIVREARPGDQPTLLDLSARLASETEGKTLDSCVLARGLAAALADPDRLRYWVAEEGSERSHYRPGGDHPRMERLAQRLGLVVPECLRPPRLPQSGRLPRPLGPRRDRSSALVDEEDHRAQRTYQALGLRPGGYLAFEEIWPERFLQG
jgi:hypothetical protein